MRATLLTQTRHSSASPRNTDPPLLRDRPCFCFLPGRRFGSTIPHHIGQQAGSLVVGNRFCDDADHAPSVAIARFAAWHRLLEGGEVSRLLAAGGFGAGTKVVVMDLFATSSDRTCQRASLPSGQGEFVNTGAACWDECGEANGPCAFCGTAGECCLVGRVGSGCDGTEGASTSVSTCTEERSTTESK